MNTKREIAKQVLLGAGALGAFGAVIVCPGLVHLVPSEYRRRYPTRLVRQAVLRLDKRGLIIARKDSDD